MDLSDDDEVPVVMLDNEADDEQQQPVAPQPAPQAKTPSASAGHKKRHKVRKGKRTNNTAKVQSPAPQQQQQQSVPPLFSMAGSLVGKARSIFSPPPGTGAGVGAGVPAQSQTVPNTPAYNTAIDSANFGYFGNYSQPQLGPDIPSMMSHEDVEKKERLQAQQDQQQQQQPQKSVVQQIRDLNPAIFIATVSVGFLIVHQKEIIEVYLHEGIGMMFNCINYLTIAGALLGGLFVLTKYVILKGLNYLNQPQQPQNQQQQQTQAPPTIHSSPQFHDPTAFHPYSKFKDDFQFPASATTTAFNEPFFQRRLGNAPTQLPPLDTDFHHHNPQGRSFSQPAIPPILNPTPQYAQPRTATHRHEMSFGENTGPQTAPIHDFKSMQSSYFQPQYDLGSPVDIGEDATTPKYKQPSPPRITVPRPSPLQRNESNPSPLYMPENPQMPTLHSDSEEEEEERNFEPVRDYSPKKRTIFTNPKRVVFRRREPDSERVSPKEDAYVDDFSCKPYGAPPKRYHGVNV